MTESYAYDVFISYRWVEPDQTWVRKHLVPALVTSGLRVLLDVEDFQPGRDLIEEMTRAGAASRRVICVLTPAYFDGNRMVAFESLAVRRADPSGSESRLIPLVLKAVELPEWLKGLISIDWTHSASRAREWGKLLKALGSKQMAECPPEPNSDVVCQPKNETPPQGYSLVTRSSPQTSFAIGKGFALVHGLDALTAKFIQASGQRELPQIACPWLSELEQEVANLDTIASQTKAEEARFLELAKLIAEVREKLGRVRWMISVLLSNSTLLRSSEQNSQMLEPKYQALALVGIINIENYIAQRDRRETWNLFKDPENKDVYMYLPENVVNSMEQCTYPPDWKKRGVEEGMAYPISVFLTQHFAQFVVPSILVSASYNAKLRDDPARLSEHLDMTMWYFSKSSQWDHRRIAR